MKEIKLPLLPLDHVWYVDEDLQVVETVVRKIEIVNGLILYHADLGKSTTFTSDDVGVAYFENKEDAEYQLLELEQKDEDYKTIQTTYIK